MVKHGKVSKYYETDCRLRKCFVLLPSSDINMTFSVYTRILENLAGCHTMFLFAVFCKIGALERNAY